MVKSAAACLKPSGRFCGFSPCIEQVQRTAEQLRANGFTDVSCIECLLRFYEQRSNFTFPPHLGSAAPAAPSAALSAQLDATSGKVEDGSAADAVKAAVLAQGVLESDLVAGVTETAAAAVSEKVPAAAGHGARSGLSLTASPQCSRCR